MKTLLSEIKGCTYCSDLLPHSPRPVMAASANSRIAIIGQAPGSKVHASGVPWDDQSGKLLRKWMGVSDEEFYDPEIFAIIPMGFCYPGKGKSGDLPPRPECAQLWHDKLMKKLPRLELILLIGQYAQKYYLGDEMKRNLTETVHHFDEYWPRFLPLPHPSPRNRFWLKKNQWFELDVLPLLEQRVQEILAH